MNKIYSLLFLWLCQVALIAHTGYGVGIGEDGKDDGSGGVVGQDSIGQPIDTVTYYTLQTIMMPNNVEGYTNWQNGTLQAGESSRVYTYCYSQYYKFQCWKEGDSIVSTSSEFDYIMPAHDVTLQAVYKFDPTSPPNPEKLGKRYTATFVSQPVQAGEFNSRSRQVNEGGTFWVETWGDNNYRFIEWQLDGATLSKDQYFEYVMPGRNVTLTAVYKFEPASPANPGKNEWQKETGKIIIDDFQEGNLSSAIWQLTHNDEEASNITEIVVVGKASRWDFQAGESYSNCAILDFSRTSGIDYIPGWCYSENQSLNKVLLPSSISTVREYAFYNCANLSEVCCYAVVPPTLNNRAFAGIAEGAVLYVPAASIPLYEKADGWKDIFSHIMPLQEEVGGLSVTLPDASYKGLYLELVNAKSGQKMRYLITDRTTYTFSNLMDQSEWKVYLKNTQDIVLAESDAILIEKKKTSDCTFAADQIQTLRNLSLKVTVPTGEEVTDQTTIRWFDAKGTFLTQGSQLVNQMVGTELKYQVILPQALAEQYKMPAEQVYTVEEEETVTLPLESLPKVTLTGSVVDEQDSTQPLADAVISVSQMLNGLYSKSQVVKTGADGKFSIEIVDTLFAPSLQLSASKKDYVSKRLSGIFEDYKADIAMQTITGATITVGFTYQKSTKSSNATPENNYADAANISYQLYNKTKEAAIAEFSAQEGKIVLLETVDNGDVLEVTATSRTNAFEPIVATATIANQKASVQFAIVQLGQIMATYGSTSDDNNRGVVGLLYDGEGNLITSEDYGNNGIERSLSFIDLTDGEYTLITMAKTTLFNSVNELSQLSETGLVEKIDYLKNTVSVQKGKITVIENGFVPNLDETKLYYTGVATAFNANKTEITIGNYLTLSARIDFKEVYANSVSDVELIIDLPKRSKVVDNSVMIGNSLGTYEVVTESGKAPRVTIPLEDYSSRIRFCFIPTVAGNFAPSAYVRFKFGNRTITQPIGSAPFKANELSINVPSVVASNAVPVSGVAFGKSIIEIYDDDVLVGQTTALANGSYAATVELFDVEPEVVSDHQMYAHITLVDGTKMQTETKTVTYDEQAVQVEDVTLLYSNPEINQNYRLVFDFQNPSTKPFRYTYYIYNRSFTFTIKLTGNAVCDEVILYVKTGDGRWNKLKAEWNEAKGVYVANGSFGNMYDGIVPVNVRVYIGCGNIFFESGYPDCDVPIDPSGYVYEAVPSNRLQGVTTTAYYKEEVEDQFGDKHENIILWNAEEYAQENPLFTDENGMYRWDVPAGMWQVKFEKDGYVTTYSDWLPVPPPQLEVNVPMTQNIQPSVTDVKANEDGVEVIFDKYMLPETLVPENFIVTKNGEPLAGTIELLDQEAAEEGSDIFYASRVKFIPADGIKLLQTDEVKLTVSKSVKSYAGIPMEEDKHQDFEVTPVVTKIEVDEMANISNDGTALKLLVAAQPVEAANGKKLTIKTDPMFVTVKSGDQTSDAKGNLVITLDEEGQAEISIYGAMSGFTTMLYSIEESDVKAQTKVKVVDAASLITVAPIASRANGSTLYRGDQVALSTQTEDAKIYYTLDGTEPTAESAEYKEPIGIDHTTTIKAMAQGEGLGLQKSDTKTFGYTIKQNGVNMNLAAGWNWISHNLADAQDPKELFSNSNVVEIKSQTKGLIRDSKFGLIGNLNTLEATQTYKVKTNAAVNQADLMGDAFNATTGYVTLKQGWNWMGYPIYGPATLDEAFAKAIPTEGDVILSKDGKHAEYTGGAWTGDLKMLEPGKGYMYNSVAANNFLFNTTLSNLAKARSFTAQKNYASHWVADIHQYPNVMPIAAELYVNGAKAEADSYSVGAFCGTECRGVGKFVKGVLFLGVQGEGGENIKFYAMNNETEEIYDVTEQLNFTGDRQGSFNAPYSLHISGEATDIANLNAELQVSPAVARDVITVTLPAENIDQVSVFNTNGVAVISANQLNAPAQINVSTLSEGIYIVVVKSQGKTYYQKIVKRN